MNSHIPQTTAELFNMLTAAQGLAGNLSLTGSIFWQFSDFWVNAFLENGEGYISVHKNKTHWWQEKTLIHWHPSPEEIYGALVAIGSRENLLVIKTALWGASVFFCGKESEYQFTPDKKRHWGKLHYFKPADECAHTPASPPPCSRH